MNLKTYLGTESSVTIVSTLSDWLVGLLDLSAADVSNPTDLYTAADLPGSARLIGQVGARSSSSSSSSQLATYVMLAARYAAEPATPAVVQLYGIDAAGEIQRLCNSAGQTQFLLGTAYDPGDGVWRSLVTNSNTVDLRGSRWLLPVVTTASDVAGSLAIRLV